MLFFKRNFFWFSNITIFERYFQVLYYSKNKDLLYCYLFQQQIKSLGYYSCNMQNTIQLYHFKKNISQKRKLFFYLTKQIIAEHFYMLQLLQIKKVLLEKGFEDSERYSCDTNLFVVKFFICVITSSLPLLCQTVSLKEF